MPIPQEPPFSSAKDPMHPFPRGTRLQCRRDYRHRTFKTFWLCLGGPKWQTNYHLPQDLELIREMATNARVFALSHLFYCAQLPCGFWTRTIYLRVAALSKQLKKLIINLGVYESIVLDYLSKLKSGLILNRWQGLFRPHLTPPLYINYSLTELNNKHSH
jgi:hypothetical protein